MEFRRRTKKLSGLPIAFYVVALLFFVLLLSFNAGYYKTSELPKPVITEIPKPKEEPKPKLSFNPEVETFDLPPREEEFKIGEDIPLSTICFDDMDKGDTLDLGIVELWKGGTMKWEL